MSTLPPPTLDAATRPRTAVDPAALPGLAPRAAAQDDWRSREPGLIPLPAPTSWAFMGVAVARVVTHPASFGKRLFARIWDLLVYGGISMLIVVAAKQIVLHAGDSLSASVQSWITLATIPLVWLVQVVWLRAIAVEGATAGGRRAGIRIVRPGTMDPIGWGRTLVREAVRAVFSVAGVTLVVVGALRLDEPGRTGPLLVTAGVLVYLVDPLWMLFDRDERTLHDIAAGCRVIDLRS